MRGKKAVALIVSLVALPTILLGKSESSASLNVTNGVVTVRRNCANDVVGLMTNGWNKVKLNRIAKERFADGIRITGKIMAIDDVTHSITMKTTTKPTLEVFAYVGKHYRSDMEELKLGEMIELDGKISAINSFGENTLVLWNARPVIKR